MLTIVTFVCCKKFWKTRKQGMDLDEAHTYRMPICPTELFWRDQFATLSPSQLPTSSLTNCNGFVNPTLPLSTYPPSSSYLDNNQINISEPPPSYHSISSNTNNNRFLSLLSSSHRRDLVYPVEGRKGLWRTLSQ
jgi:hypothetical protein